jgi:Ca2+-binding RTX toxin-like protein
MNAAPFNVGAKRAEQIEGSRQKMRRIMIMAALVALLAAMYATGAGAFAKIITGETNNDYLVESPGADTLKGFAGNDSLDAQIWGGYTGREDRDILRGGRYSDALITFDEDNLDVLRGGKGRYDKCIGDVGDTYGGGCEIVRRFSN